MPNGYSLAQLLIQYGAPSLFASEWIVNRWGVEDVSLLDNALRVKLKADPDAGNGESPDNRFDKRNEMIKELTNYEPLDRQYIVTGTMTLDIRLAPEGYQDPSPQQPASPDG